MPKEKESKAPRQIESETNPKLAGPESISPLIIVSPILISIVMSGLLGFFFGLTKEPIEKSKKLEEQTKLQTVMPAFDNDPLAEPQAVSDTITIFTGEQGGAISGYGIKSSVETGYSGHFSVMFGVNPDGSVNKVQILDSAETPGLGSKASEPFFIDQFNGKLPGDFIFKVVKDGGNIDAITGATITSRAVCDCVQNGLDALGEIAAAAPPAESSLAAPAADAQGTVADTAAPPADSSSSAVEDTAAVDAAADAEAMGDAAADPSEDQSADPGAQNADPSPAEEPAGGE